MKARRAEADKFYATVIPPALTADQAMVMRQALAGMLWGKQYYEYDVHRWLREHGVDPWGPNAPTSGVRNVQWFHMIAGDIISMPDKWEYPWFAAWDLAFHCAPLSLVDVDFAKEQVELLLKTRYLHPNGQIPAYEWNFSDVNPPVTPWAALYVYEREAEIRGEGDPVFLARVFDRLLTNFTWWVNRKDPDDRNLFQGGFLGLDNIGIFDRSAPLPGGGQLEQADGTAWMALYCQWMLQIAIELSREQPAYIDMALKFIAHFMWISVAMNPPRGRLHAVGRPRRLLLRRDANAGRADDRAEGALAGRAAADVRGDRVRARRARPLPADPRAAQPSSSSASRIRSRSSPICPGRAPRAGASPHWSTRIACGGSSRSCSTRTSSSGLTGSARSRAVTSSSPSCSTGAARSTTSTTCPPSPTPGCSAGNSNWRGPVWFPMNLVILRGLIQLHRYYGDRVKVECPTGSGPRAGPGGGRRRDRGPPDDDVHRGRERAPAGVRRASRSSRPTRTGTT